MTGFVWNNLELQNWLSPLLNSEETQSFAHIQIAERFFCLSGFQSETLQFKKHTVCHNLINKILPYFGFYKEY